MCCGGVVLDATISILAIMYSYLNPIASDSSLHQIPIVQINYIAENLNCLSQGAVPVKKQWKEFSFGLVAL